MYEAVKVGDIPNDTGIAHAYPMTIAHYRLSNDIRPLSKSIRIINDCTENRPNARKAFS
jgi:hypothetical protein